MSSLTDGLTFEELLANLRVSGPDDLDAPPPHYSTPPATPPPPPQPTTPARTVLYSFETPTQQGFSDSWATAGAATQGVSGAKVRRIQNGPQKKQTRKAAYTVFYGIVPGVYAQWDDAKANTNRVPGAIHRGYTTCVQAEDAYAYARARGWKRTYQPLTVANPVPSPYTIPALPTPSEGLDTVNPLHGSEVLENTWFVVYHGILPGVYHSLLEAQLNTVGIRNSRYESVEGRDNAFLKFGKAASLGETGVAAAPPF
ncbi:hypothetical protein DFH07DRAFT_974409 [Mycena maculata]|uniref:Ribonuclease H1 N-terminal domain-containing protein n=1 Tax=Mycena maculata TaxID=230809 RepID=A0AAD7MFE2_9AGAR|nr:hypothetical protein DFH07DRAFT_974409 [Mycena maculata]